jgi:hypothetical protein
MVILIVLTTSGNLNAQSQVTVSKPNYPYVKGYLSFIIPWVTINKDETVTEFEKATTIGFPVGLNVYYSDKFGFSFEFTPLIVWQQSTGKPGTSKTSNLVFDPGPMFRFQHGFNIVARLAFETAGRYGFTPVFNKVYARTSDVDYWFSISFPARFGNSLPASIGVNLQIGFTLN